MKNFNLEDRTTKFAIDVRKSLKKIKDERMETDIKQVIKSSGSIAANYIEANENLGKKDLLFRMKIARKESKETIHWLLLIKSQIENEAEIDTLLKEANELRSILSAIIIKISKTQT